MEKKVFVCYGLWRGSLFRPRPLLNNVWLVLCVLAAKSVCRFSSKRRKYNGVFEIRPNEAPGDFNRSTFGFVVYFFRVFVIELNNYFGKRAIEYTKLSQIGVSSTEDTYGIIRQHLIETIQNT